MTSMDIWMLICMLFVASAQFEYAIQLKNRFGITRKISINTKEENKTRAEEKSRKMDCIALNIFMVVYIMTVGAYFYKMVSF